MKKIIATLGETAPSIEFIGAVTSTELYGLADALKQMAAALEKLTANGSVGQPNNNIYPARTVLSEMVAATGKALPLTNDGQPAKQPQPTPDKDVIAKFLTRRGVTNQEQKPKVISPERQQKLDELTIFLGKNFSECKTFYQWLKKQLSQPGAITLYLFTGVESKQVKLITELCRLLEAAELIDSLTALDLPGPGIQFKLASSGLNYLAGHWLERFVRLEFDRIAKNSGGKGYEVKSNLLLTFENEEKAELDLIFATGNQVFCIEAKTYPGSKELKNYLKKIEPLRMNPQNLLIVTAERSPEQCQSLTRSLGGVQVIGLDKLEEALISMIKASI